MVIAQQNPQYTQNLGNPAYYKIADPEGSAIRSIRLKLLPLTKTLFRLVATCADYLIICAGFPGHFVRG